MLEASSGRGLGASMRGFVFESLGHKGKSSIYQEKEELKIKIKRRRRKKILDLLFFLFSFSF